MSMELSTFQTFPGGKQGRKSPLNNLINNMRWRQF